MSSIFTTRVCCYAVIILFLCLSISHGGRIKRIVGGMPVSCDDQPRVASLRNSTNDQHLCGAMVLTPEYALTAAHCTEKPAEEYVLQLRNMCIGDNETYPTATIVDVITNEHYNKYTRAHDLCILQISFKSNDVSWLNDDPVLPVSSFGLSSECTIYGYGSIDPVSGNISDSLLGGRVDTVSLDECVERLGPYVAPAADSGMLCALGDHVDACQGDSGGPMICANSILQGISSYGQSCGVAGLPGVYASVGAHLSWINQIIHRPPPDTTNNTKPNSS